jgi:ArsR family transcriptional regulator
MGEGMKIAPSTLSHHLKALHYAGLIEMERQGKHINCWIDPGVLDMLSEFFKQQTVFLKIGGCDV